MCYFNLSLILVLHLKQPLTVLNGELGDDRACPEHITVKRNVVAEDLGENPSVLQPPVQCLMPRPHSPLHSPIFRRNHVVPRQDSPRRPRQEVTQNFVENCYVGILTGRVWPLNPHQVPCKDVDAQLIAKGGLPRVLVGREGVPLRRDSLWGNT